MQPPDQPSHLLAGKTADQSFDRLVEKLVADLEPVGDPPVAQRLAIGLGVGLVLSVTLVGLVLGFRPDMQSATLTLMFWV